MGKYSILLRGAVPVASANNCAVSEFPGNDNWEGIDSIKCYFFGRVNLTPPVLFEHLAGTGLAQFFNSAEIVLNERSLARDLRYVHGRSEVMRGKHHISSVLLAHPESQGTVTDATWLSNLPAIYKKFLSMRSD